MVTASVCLCGSDGSFDSMGEGMFCNFDGTVMVEGSRRPDEIITCEVRPDLVREARTHWAVENNPYQLWHRGYVAVKGGAMDCPYTFMHDMVHGRFRLPWEDEVVHTDGTSCGFAAPTRAHDPENMLGDAADCRARAGRRGMQKSRRDDMRAVARLEADPYPWPYDGDLRPTNTALVVIDMQTDFCGVGGYVDKMGYDLSLTRAPIEPIRKLMARDARSSASTIIHTREGHRPDLSDLPANKRWRSRRIGAGHRRRRAVRPHPRSRRAGLGDHPRARAARRRSVIDKPGKGSFCATDLELLLRTRGITNLRPRRHHHRRLRPHDDARGQRPRLRVPAPLRLHRRDRPRQPRRRAEDGDDAGRRVRRGRVVERVLACVVVSRRARPTMTAPLDPIPPPTGALALETFELTKRFGAFTAMDSVTMKVAPGSVHALLGENGAGKSTLVKCVAGSQRPDGGAIVVDGRERDIATPVVARSLGIGMVYQHFTLAPNMSVAENLLLAGGRMPALIDWAKARAELEQR